METLAYATKSMWQHSKFDLALSACWVVMTIFSIADHEPREAFLSVLIALTLGQRR